MKNLKVIFLYLFLHLDQTHTNNRPSSYPYISGDTFRSICDFVVDESNPNPFDPDKVKKGDIVFVSTSQPFYNLRDFFTKYHPKIKHQYILVTHNGDANMPNGFKAHLEDKKIYAWFSQNVEEFHPKLIHIPIGLENKHWQRNYDEIINDLLKNKINDKKNLLYVNFNIGTNKAIREPIAKLFSSKKFCNFDTSRLNVKDYLNNVYNSKFIISPHGNGLDCHRTWEALYLNVIPIVKKSSLDKLYEGLPVLIVNSWEDITEEFLTKKYIDIWNKKHMHERKYFNYWKELIIKYKKKCLEEA